MAELYSPLPSCTTVVAPTRSQNNFQSKRKLPLAVLQLQPARPAPIAPQTATCVRLDWENLQCFDTVDRQFQSYGVRFQNAVALHPSNPAYPPRSGKVVVMGAPKSGWIEAYFLKPTTFVGGYVTSSRRATLTAFNVQDEVIAQSETIGNNLAEPQIAANLELNVQAGRIHRIVFQSFDGQITLDDFRFHF